MNQNAKALIVPVRGGHLLAEASADPDNPGISVCFVSERHPDALVDIAYIENTAEDCLPRRIDPNQGEVIRTLCYTDPWTEDYTHEHAVFVNEIEKAISSVEEDVLCSIQNGFSLSAMANSKAEANARIATDIQWDTDGDEEALDSLPTEVEIPSSVDDESIGDYLSALTGFCHKAFAIKYEEEEKK